MSAIYYKFKSESGPPKAIAFDGASLSLGELKRLIVQQNKLALGPDHALSIVDTQTNEGGCACFAQSNFHCIWLTLAAPNVCRAYRRCSLHQ